MSSAGVLLPLWLSACQAPIAPCAQDTATDEDLLPLEEGEVRTCAGGVNLPTYRDVAPTLGLAGSVDPDGDHIGGGWFALEDLDRDGWLDLVIGYPFEAYTVYRGTESGFSASLAPWGSSSLGLLDLDGDGTRELMTVMGDAGALYAFEFGPDEVTVSAALPNPISSTDAARRDLAFGDFDGDGDVDLFVVATVPEDVSGQLGGVVWRTPDGWEVGPETPDALDPRHGFDAVPLDWDGDGDDELYIVNDMGAQFGANVLLDFVDGQIVDITDECLCGVATSAMSVTAADANGDGAFDLHVGGGPRSFLLSLGDGTYVDARQASGIDGPEPLDMTGNVPLVDMDNDGLLDAIVPFGDWWGGEFPENALRYEAPVYLLLQDAVGRFSDVSPAAFPTEGSWRSALARDVNDDGVLDVLLSQARGTPAWLVSEACTRGAWIEVDAPEGAMVEVYVGDRRWIARATTDEGAGASGVPRVHIGLGEVDTVDLVRVRLPDGTLYGARDVPARQRMAVPGARSTAIVALP